MKRLASALAVAALIPSMALAAAPRSTPLPPPENQKLARDIFAELVGINTTHDVGTLKAAEAVVARLKAAGFADADIHLLTVDGNPTQGNVVVRLKGKGKGRPVLFECHLDVVEAKPEDWTLPPFQLTEKDGYFYGRGAIDMKNEDAAVLASLIRLKQEGFVPDRDIIVVFTSDEEGGDANGVKWLLEKHRGLVDAEFAVNTEDGGGSIEDGKRLGYTVQTSEKTYVTFGIEATAPGGHSSHPEPGNPIYRLAEALVKLSKLEFPLRLNDTIKGLMKARAADATGQLHDDLLAAAGGDLKAAERVASDPDWTAYLRTTCVATQQSGGHAENALPQRAFAVIQCRMMPGDTEADTMKFLADAIGDPEVKLSVVWPAELSGESPPTPKLMATVQGVVSGMWPGVTISPGMDAGASDALYSRAAGIPTYGLSGTFFEVGDNRAHGRDERVKASTFYEDVEFNYRLMKALSAAGSVK